jgi:hypothetical protein
MTRPITGRIGGAVLRWANDLLGVGTLLVASVTADPNPAAPATPAPVPTSVTQATAENATPTAPALVTRAIEQGVDVGGVRVKMNVSSCNVSFSWQFRF